MFSFIIMHCRDESTVGSEHISGRVGEIRSGCNGTNTNHNVDEGSGETNGMYSIYPHVLNMTYLQSTTCKPRTWRHIQSMQQHGLRL